MSRRGDFIADVLLKLGDTLTAEHRIQLEAFAREHKLNLNSIKKKSAKKRKFSIPKKSTTAEASSSETKSLIDQSSGDQALSEVSAMKKP